MTAVDRLPPSHFAALGAPTCSRWGKLEIELLALAYVQALAASGDEWRRIPSRAAVFDLLTRSQRSEVRAQTDDYRKCYGIVEREMSRLSRICDDEIGVTDV